MRRALIALLSLLLALSLSGCKLKRAIEQASVSAELASKGTTDLLKEAARDEYTAPEDGRLTEAQVQMYLKVRDREKAIVKVARQELQQHAAKANAAGGEKSLAGVMEGFKSLGSVADIATADIRAAQELSFNTQEYTWVKGQILAASGSVVTQKMQESMKAQMAAIEKQLKADPTTARLFEQAKADPGQAEAPAEPEDPALAYNRQLLSRYENALNAFTSEMSKWEEKEGDAARSMTEWQKAADKAIAEAEKPAAQP